jgi:hypothetical protein
MNPRNEPAIGEKKAFKVARKKVCRQKIGDLNSFKGCSMLFTGASWIVWSKPGVETRG